MLLLITNSDYVYTKKMMAYVFDPYLPLGMNRRSLFGMVSFQSFGVCIQQCLCILKNCCSVVLLFFAVCMIARICRICEEVFDTEGPCFLRVVQRVNV
jgi:hypothetical protein